MPFDGETQGNSAEVAGGRAVVAGLVGEARENVNLVNQFMNDGVARMAQALPPLQLFRAAEVPARQREQGNVAQAGNILRNVLNTIRQFVNPITPTPPPQRAPQAPRVPRPRTIRTPGPPIRRSRRIHALTEGRLTVDLTQRDDPEDLGTEIIDLTHLN